MMLKAGLLFCLSQRTMARWPHMRSHAHIACTHGGPAAYALSAVWTPRCRKIPLWQAGSTHSSLASASHISAVTDSRLALSGCLDISLSELSPQPVRTGYADTSA